MKAPVRKTRCAIYTRVSTDERLDMEFNSLDAQREAALAYIQSQRHEGWILVGDRYDDGGYSGGTMERPALQRLLRDVGRGVIDVVVVYKVDRPSPPTLFGRATRNAQYAAYRRRNSKKRSSHRCAICCACPRSSR